MMCTTLLSHGAATASVGLGLLCYKRSNLESYDVSLSVPAVTYSSSMVKETLLLLLLWQHRCLVQRAVQRALGRHVRNMNGMSRNERSYSSVDNTGFPQLLPRIYYSTPYLPIVIAWPLRGLRIMYSVLRSRTFTRSTIIPMISEAC